MNLATLPDYLWSFYSNENNKAFSQAHSRVVTWQSLLLAPHSSESALRLVTAKREQDYIHQANRLDQFLAFSKQKEENPLDDGDPKWARIREIEALRVTIAQDVQRCMPDTPFFRYIWVQEAMIKVLMVRFWEQKDGYRQGMHELVGVITWVVAGGGGRDGETDDSKAPAIDDTVWTLFCSIIDWAVPFYEGFLERAERIIGLIPKVDPELANNFAVVDVLPQVFLVRWVRLLFGRQFPLDQILEMWDLIFAFEHVTGVNGQGNAKRTMGELMDWICVTMILRLRSSLLQADTNTALKLLHNQYPPLPNGARATSLVYDAWILMKNPSVSTSYALIHKWSGRRPINRELPYSLRTKAVIPQQAPLPSFEAMLGDAVKNIHATGEKWGVNQRVCDAISEVKRVASTTSRKGEGTLAESDSPPSSRTLLALEERNSQLAGMMEKAVNDLWNVQEKLSGANTHQMDKMTKAVARIQFAQAFLKDSSLPLPLEDEEEETNMKKEKKTSLPPSQQSIKSTPPSTQQSTTTPLSPSQKSRRRIADSSLSWILDSTSKDDSPPRSSSRDKSLFKDELGKERRSGIKGLFGNDENEEEHR